MAMGCELAEAENGRRGCGIAFFAFIDDFLLVLFAVEGDPNGTCGFRGHVDFLDPGIVQGDDFGFLTAFFASTGQDDGAEHQHGQGRDSGVIHLMFSHFSIWGFALIQEDNLRSVACFRNGHGPAHAG